MRRVGDEGAVLQGAKTPAAAASGSPYVFRTPATSRRMQQASSSGQSHTVAANSSTPLHEVWALICAVPLQGSWRSACLQSRLLKVCTASAGVVVVVQGPGAAEVHTPSLSIPRVKPSASKGPRLRHAADSQVLPKVSYCLHANDISSCMALLLPSDQSVAILLNSCACHGGFM